MTGPVLSYYLAVVHLGKTNNIPGASDTYIVYLYNSSIPVARYCLPSCLLQVSPSVHVAASWRPTRWPWSEPSSRVRRGWGRSCLCPEIRPTVWDCSDTSYGLKASEVSTEASSPTSARSVKTEIFSQIFSVK